MVEQHESIQTAKVFVQKGEVHLQTNNENLQDIVAALNPLLHSYGYTLYVEKPVSKIAWGDYMIAL
ncbi:MAG: hypothetical protein WCJ81_02220 [bacterium]